MPDLLLELFQEEIPARMQRKAAGDLKKLVTDALVDNGLTYEVAGEFWTPRRLTLDIRGLTARSADLVEERKGPRTDAPEKAIQGFLRGAGLSSIDEATVKTDPKKGDFYVATIRKEGRAAEDIIADVLPSIIRGFPWPKSMRWGAASAEPGSLRWVRPLQSILCTFGPETEEPVVIAFDVDGIQSGNTTCGHRFHAGDEFTVRRFDDYAEQLAKRYVILDADRRKDMILTDAKNLAFANGVELVEDEGLLEEVSGLVEWPVVLMGEFEEDYLQIPDEVVRLTIKANQKCFVCRGADGKLTNKFILISNIEATDGGKEIARGNGKVVRARLSDALHFWNTDQADLPDLGELEASAAKFDLDLKKPLDQRMAKLDNLGVTFHAKLGTQGERVARIAALAEELADVVGADKAPVKRAAHLAKADLTTEIVGEFPEVQGSMGRTYAEMQGEHASVAIALEDHYKPQGPSDAVPTDPAAITVALADKLDTLTGFWAIDEKPTGSKDPYALRRAALGVIRIVLENGLRTALRNAIDFGYLLHLWEEQSREKTWFVRGTEDGWFYSVSSIFVVWKDSPVISISSLDRSEPIQYVVDESGKETAQRAKSDRFEVTETSLKDAGVKPSLGEFEASLLSFFHDRLKVYLRDKGARHDLIDAIVGPEDDDLLLLVRKVEALQKLVESETGANLLAGTKRAMNILAAEEKKDGDGAFAKPVDASLFAEDAEKQLADTLSKVSGDIASATDAEDYEAAFGALAELRPAVDAFFEGVMVNADDPAVRVNRLALLNSLRDTTRSLADFTKIEG